MKPSDDSSTYILSNGQTCAKCGKPGSLVLLFFYRTYKTNQPMIIILAEILFESVSFIAATYIMYILEVRQLWSLGVYFSKTLLDKTMQDRFSNFVTYSSIDQKDFILQDWLKPFWIAYIMITLQISFENMVLGGQTFLILLW